jgi:hypothetical protein
MIKKAVSFQLSAISLKEIPQVFLLKGKSL